MNFFIFIRFYNFTKNGRAHFFESARSQQPYWNWTSSPAVLKNLLRDFTAFLGTKRNKGVDNSMVTVPFQNYLI